MRSVAWDGEEGGDEEEIEEELIAMIDEALAAALGGKHPKRTQPGSQDQVHGHDTHGDSSGSMPQHGQGPQQVPQLAGTADTEATGTVTASHAGPEAGMGSHGEDAGARSMQHAVDAAGTNTASATAADRDDIEPLVPAPSQVAQTHDADSQSHGSSLQRVDVEAAWQGVRAAIHAALAAGDGESNEQRLDEALDALRKQLGKA